MAKDKSKTKGGAAATTDDEFGKPSDAPAGGDGFKITDAKDRLLLITPIREETKPAYGKAGQRGETQEVIIADVVVIDEKKPEKSEEHSDVWIFQGYLKGALRGYIGDRRVLARLRWTEDTTKATSSSGGYYWEFEDGTKKDVELARAYMTAANDPFGKKGKADKKKAAPEPEPKKGKGKKK